MKTIKKLRALKRLVLPFGAEKHLRTQEARSPSAKNE